MKSSHGWSSAGLCFAILLFGALPWAACNRSNSVGKIGDTSAAGGGSDGASTTQATAVGGHTTAGGASSTAGKTSAEATTAPGGAATTGGTTAAGGTTATGGGTTTTGCDVGLESMVDVHGHSLRVATFVTVGAACGSSTYQIDATEVTRGQYEDWLATNPPLPSSSDAECGWKSAGSFAQDSSCMAASSVCKGAGCEAHPVVCVDWCAAYHYCAAVNKRLCGRIGGGASRSNKDDPSASQWRCACTSGGANTYPYGSTYQPEYCNGLDYWRSINGTTMAVAAMSKCQASGSGSCAVYDLSGNVYEWEDSCYPTLSYALDGDASPGRPACYFRGGAFNSYGVSGYSPIRSEDMECSGVGSDTRDRVDPSIGFRCCSM